MTRERLTLWLLLAATFAVRAIHPDQPIVENYVGRQIPTAMVARNLERGSGFLHPQLDTGPFPNLFLVEPPIYAQVVASIRPIIGFDLEPTGRLVSAAATALAAWGLFGLARRREGLLTAFLALASFSLFPVMIRYGRAFQPDALMLGCVLAGLRGWDEYEDQGDWRWAAFGGFVLSTGLALKVTAAWALIPFALIVRRWPVGVRAAALAAMLLPAVAWYVLAWDRLASPGTGSLASSENAKIWARAASPEAWLRFGTYADLGRNLVIRSFTPIGFVLASWGLLASGKLDRLWLGWGAGCGLSILGLASKWHHSYYWMVVAPLASVGVARGLVRLAGLRKLGWPLAVGLGSSFLGLCLVQSASTWETPKEWASLGEAANAIAALTSEDEMIVASEAILHHAGRKGYRLEFEPAAARRAANEWIVPRDGDGWSLLPLTELYWNIHRMESHKLFMTAHGTVIQQSSDHLLVADVGLDREDAGRRAWREQIRARGRTKVLIDRPDLFIAELH
jgi:4-amino-4-deoxy-L-arabinose transferase-like glycosyltransferase